MEHLASIKADQLRVVDPSVCTAGSWDNLPLGIWKKVADNLDEKSLHRLACCSPALLDTVGWQPGTDLNEDQRFFEMALGWLQQGLLQQLGISNKQLLTLYFPRTYKAIEIRFNHGFVATFRSNIMPPVCQKRLAWQRRAGAPFGFVGSTAPEPEVYHLSAYEDASRGYRERSEVPMMMEQLLNYTRQGPRAQYSMFTLETGMITSCRIVHEAVALMRRYIADGPSHQFSVKLWSSSSQGTQHPYNMTLTRKFCSGPDRSIEKYSDCSKQRHHYAYLICVSRSGDGLLDYLCSCYNRNKSIFFRA